MYDIIAALLSYLFAQDQKVHPAPAESKQAMLSKTNQKELKKEEK